MENKGGHSLLFILLFGSLLLGVNLIFTRNFLISKNRVNLLAQLSTTTANVSTSTSSSTTTSLEEATSISVSTSSTSTISSTATNTDSNSTNSLSGDTDFSGDEEEEEDFSPDIEGNVDSLNGAVKVKMKHKIKADSVFLKITLVDTDQERLRILMPPDFFNTYEYLFNTRLVPDDYYHLSFIKIKNKHIKESQKIKVKITNNVNLTQRDAGNSISNSLSSSNATSSTSTGSSSVRYGSESVTSQTSSVVQSATSSGTTTPNLQQQPTIIYDLKLNKNPSQLKGKVKVSLRVNIPLLSAKVLLKKINVDALIDVGQMIREEDDKWQLEIDTRLQPNDSYDLFASVVTDYGESLSPGMKIVINNDLKPPVLIIIEGNKFDIKERIKIKAKVDDADDVNLFIRRKESLAEVLINRLNKSNDHEWEYEFNSKDQPNGDYMLFVKVKNIFGEYKSEEILVKINNPIPQATNIDTEKILDNLTSGIQEDILKISTTTPKREELRNEMIEKLNKEVEKVKKYIENKPFEVQERRAKPEPVKVIPQDVKMRLDKRFGQAVAVSVTTTTTTASLATPVITATTATSAVGIIATSTKEGVMSISVEELNKAVEQRIEDFDNDGLTNEAEINIYKTNPLNADSDNDGFIDGHEVFSGFAPDVPSPADKIIYEEPKDAGVEKPKIYKVDDIKLEIETDNSGQVVGKKLILKGSALPNSFVTLYIYSLPTILVVKADEFGHWEYHLEKDLGEGEHTVYVALTDNKGRVVEKSSSYKFIQQAQAITVLDVEKSVEIAKEAVKKTKPLSSVSFLDNEGDSLLSDYVFLGFVITVVAFLVAVTSLVYVIHKYSSKRL